MSGPNPSEGRARDSDGEIRRKRSDALPGTVRKPAFNVRDSKRPALRPESEYGGRPETTGRVSGSRCTVELSTCKIDVERSQ